MCKRVSPRVGVAIAAALGLSACVTLPPNHVKNPQDPWESWNRGVYKVNNKLDRAVALPVAKAYVRHVPGGIRKSVSNFFANVITPGVMVNDALEGKFKNAASDLGRFLLNSVVGLGGLFDPASSAGLDRNYADFGLTLGHWGVHQGPFFELPILGPSTVRDGLGKVPDYYLRPTTYIPSDWIVGYVLWLPAAVDARAELLPLQPTLDQAYDPYAVIRDAYLSRRAYLVSDGKVSPSSELVDPDAGESPAPGGPSIATPPSEASPSPGAAPIPGSAPQPATPSGAPPEPAPSPQPPPP
jgi:phospholipid-binding lipoprotein MlaA